MEDFIKLISYLFHSQIQVHIFHLQTKSFAEHKALNDYYDEITDLIDGLVESYQGKYEILKNYVSFKLVDYIDDKETISYFESINQSIEKLRKSNEDSYIQNQIDNAVELINSTLYKLKNLK